MNKDFILFEGWTYAEIEKIIRSSGIDFEPYEILDKLPYDPSFFKSKTLRFVGTYSVNHLDATYTFYCFPKYMAERGAENVDISEMEKIIKAIELAQLTPVRPEDADFNPANLNLRETRMRRTELAQWIVSDYLGNGIIRVKEKKSAFRNRGNSNWSKTVSRLISVTDGENFIYPRIYHTYYETNDELLISTIHRCAVREAAAVLESMGSTDLPELQYDSAFLGKLNSYVPFIQKMLNRVYEDKQIYTLRAVLAWSKEYSNYYDQPIGTVSFELVWERCLRYVFDNVSEDHVKGDFTFEKPIYHIDGKGDYNVLKSKGIPDIINIDDSKNFALLDAKYYLGEIKGSNIGDVPMYHDISKQIYYFDMLCAYGLDSQNGTNAFLFPVHKLCCEDNYSLTDDLYRYVGYVYYDNKSKNYLSDKFGLRHSDNDNNHGKSIVLIYQINPDKLFDLALSGGAENHQDTIQKFFDVLRRKFQEVSKASRSKQSDEKSMGDKT